jgi:asparagine synthase (glutamine-hydrolysing)
MCGIAGSYAYRPGEGVSRSELRRVSEYMRARGPDGDGEWYSALGHVGLVHRRLAVIDLSPGGAQPMANAAGDVVITYNGEIYNYRELRAGLEADGCVLRSASDTEVILQLYERHGTDMLQKLRGMFALAIWDGKRDAMLLARDAFGIKPLYFADDGRSLRFASQVKALLQGHVDTAPEPAGHAGFFLWGSVPAPWTLYRGIRVVPAGHYMWATAQGVAPAQSFCDISRIWAAASESPAQVDAAHGLEELAAAVQDSVRAHMVADVPVGVFLSGGLDSGMICTGASAASEKTVRSLTLEFAEFAGTADDEAPLSAAVARGCGTDHATIQVSRKDFESERTDILAAMDQPSVDGVNTWLVTRAAAAQGVKVALSGLGGDEVFGSYPSFREIPRILRMAAPWSRSPRLGLAVRRLSEPIVRQFTSPKYAGLMEYGGSVGGAYLLRRALYMPWELPQVLDPDMAAEGWRKLQALACLDATVQGIRGTPGNRLAVSALEMNWYMRQQLLVDADWASMAHSVELRVPFLDVPLLRRAAPVLAAHPRLAKTQVAEAVAPRLPRAVLHRRKIGFNTPLRDWVTQRGGRNERGLRGWARAALQSHES